MKFKIYYIVLGLKEPYDETSKKYQERLNLMVNISALGKCEEIAKAAKQQMYQYIGDIEYENDCKYFGAVLKDNIFIAMDNEFRPENLREKFGNIRSMMAGDILVDDAGKAFLCGPIEWKEIPNPFN